MARLKDKVALITGAAGGMGAEYSRLFAREGASVILADIAADSLADIVADITQNGGSAISVKLDVSSEDEWISAVQQALDAFGRIGVLVNNAAIAANECTVRTVTVDQWNRMMAINATGVMLGMKHVIPAMEQAGAGSIINISSIGGLVGGMADNTSR